LRLNLIKFPAMRKTTTFIVAAVAAVSFASSLFAGDNTSDTRYFGGLLDHRSIYGQFWFPEPLSLDETDVDREIRFDYNHVEGHASQENEYKAEIEYNVGLLTFEVEGSYEHNRAEGETESGFSPLEFAARHPIYQYVSPHEFFDYTLVPAFELAIPTRSMINRNDFEIVPQLDQAIRIGDRFSIQTTTGYSIMIGPDEGGANTLEYGVAFGYNIEKEDFNVPAVERIIPLFEIKGETPLNHEERFHNQVFGTVGARINFSSIGDVQPRFGLGYMFPLDSGAREEFDWGIIASFVFEL